MAKVLSWDGTSTEQILRYAAATESRSEHPIARAIVEAGRVADIALPDAVEMTALPGRGARALVEGRTVILGSPRLFRELELLEAQGEARILGAESVGATLVLVGWSESESSTPRLRGGPGLNRPCARWHDLPSSSAEGRGGRSRGLHQRGSGPGSRLSSPIPRFGAFRL